MWNSIPTLQWWLGFAQWAVIPLILLSAVPAAATLVIEKRIETLRAVANADRTLTPDQSKKLTEFLTGHPITLNVDWLTGDPEAESYANQLLEALDATRNVKGQAGPGLFTDGFKGLRLTKTDSADAKLLEEALRHADIQFIIQYESEQLRLSVGPKPNPEF